MDFVSRDIGRVSPAFSGPVSRSTLRIGEIANGELRALYAYWRGDGELGQPLRRDQLDLQRIAPLLSRIILAEVIDGGRDLVIRIAGEEIESRYHGSMRGFRLSTVSRSLPPSVTLRQWFDIVADRQPRYRHGPLPYGVDRYFLSERLLLPLFDQAGAVSHVFGAAFHLSGAGCDPLTPLIDAVVVD